MKDIRSLKSRFNAQSLFTTLLLASALGAHAPTPNPVGDATANLL